MALLAFSQAVYVLSGYFVNIVLAKRLGPVEFGLFGLVLSILVWLEITTSGIGGLAVVYAGRHGLPDSLRRAFWRAQAAASAGVFLACLLPSLAAWSAGSRTGFLLTVAFFDIAVIGFYHLGAGFLNGLRWYTAQSASSLAYSVSRTVAMVSLCLAGLGVAGALAGNVASSAFGLLACLAFLSRAAGKAYKGGARGMDVLPKAPAIIRESLSFVAIPLLYSLILFMDIFFIGALRPGNDVGVFVSAHTISKTLVFVLYAVSLAAFPAFVSSFAEGDHKRALRLFRGLGDFMLGVALPLALFFSAFSRPLLESLFGGDYGRGALSLALLAPAHFLLMALTFFIYVLFAAERRKSALLILGAAAAVDACLQLPLISQWGPGGAAAATLFSSLAGAAVTLAFIGKALGLTLNGRRTLLLAGLSLACFLTPAVLSAGTAGRAAAFMVFSVIYLLTLRRAGLISARELAGWYNMVRGRPPGGNDVGAVP